jgi:hypothetical protein
MISKILIPGQVGFLVGYFLEMEPAGRLYDTWTWALVDTRIVFQ